MFFLILNQSKSSQTLRNDGRVYHNITLISVNDNVRITTNT